MVLKGMKNTLKRSRPVVHTELGLDTLGAFEAAPEDVYEIMAGLKYRVFDILGNDLKNKQEFIESVKAPRVYDYIWIPSEHPSCYFYG